MNCLLPKVADKWGKKLDTRIAKRSGLASGSIRDPLRVVGALVGVRSEVGVPSVAGRLKTTAAQQRFS